MRDTRGKKGFHLIEAMVSMGLSAITMAGTMGLTSWIVNGNAYSSRTTTATTLGQDLMDDMRDRRYSQVIGGSDTNGIYQRTWQVSSSGATKQLNVTVQWETPNQPARQISLSTILAEE